MPLLLSGTASVVGHATQHVGELLAQIEETFTNFDALLGAARQRAPWLPAQFGPGTRLKVYVRDRDDLPLVKAAPVSYTHLDVYKRQGYARTAS